MIVLLAMASAGSAHATPATTQKRQFAAFEHQWQARYQEVDAGRLVEAAQKALAAKLGQHFSDFEVTPIGRLSPLTIRTGQLALTAHLPPGSLLRPRLAVTVDVAVNGKPAATVPVWFRVKVLGPMLIYKHDLPRATLLQRKDLRVAERDLTQAPGDVESNFQALPGRWLTHTVRAGDPVVDSELAQEPLVKRDERIKILLQSGSIAISASGVAAKNGYRGETIKVLVDGARAPCLARVVRKGVVEVVY